jgi:hypothetical protein
MPRPEAKARAWIEATFPNLRGAGWTIVSPYQPGYNCIAWAGHDDGDRWEPDIAFWLADIPRDTKPGTLIQLFSALGYEVCDTHDFEQGFEKVAIYLDDARYNFRHVARQVESGQWASKLGSWEDIEHPSVSGLEGASPAYGTARIFLKRPRD